MEDYREFLTVSVSESKSIPGMILINQSASDWLGGRLDTGTYFDILEHFGINPELFIQPLEEFAYYQIPSLEILG
jgi:hypothetical protein